MLLMRHAQKFSRALRTIVSLREADPACVSRAIKALRYLVSSKTPEPEIHYSNGIIFRWSLGFFTVEYEIPSGSGEWGGEEELDILILSLQKLRETIYGAGDSM